MLAELQHWHSSLYGLSHSHAIEDFLITCPAARDSLRQRCGGRASDETVYVSGGGDDAVELAVFIDSEVLRRLGQENPLRDLSDDRLGDLWLAMEGVSHFNYLVFNAQRDTAVSLLELELQAEVDKFVGTLTLAEEQGYRDCGRALLDKLFSATRLDSELGNDERERYAVASRYAAAFCHAIERMRVASPGGSLRELRTFFRLGRPEKLSRIHSLGA